MHSITTVYPDHRVEIRPFRPEDMGRTVELLQSVSPFSPDPSSFQSLAGGFLANGYCHACIAECDRHVIGFGSVFLLERIRGGRSAVIEDVVVSEDARRRGVGRLLVSSLLAHAAARKCFKVSLVTREDNIAFYESLGFEKDLQGMKLLLKPNVQF